jgi:hypothetical protein
VAYHLDQHPVGELHDRIHLSVRIKGFRYLKTAFKLAGIKSLSELKGLYVHPWGVFILTPADILVILSLSDYKKIGLIF